MPNSLYSDLCDVYDEGKKPYLFISYAHEDTTKVVAAIRGLQLHGGNGAILQRHALHGSAGGGPHGDNSSAGGTAFSLFDDSPAIMGFQLVEKTWDRKKVVAALEAGHLVVSIQVGGIFTTSGHFIVLSGITPEGKILVHDPNRENHQGHERFYDGFTNGFRQESVFTGGRHYWIMGKKLVHVPGCSRCADAEVETARLCQGERYCVRCTELKNKQAAFRAAVTARRMVPEI